MDPRPGGERNGSAWPDGLAPLEDAWYPVAAGQALSQGCSGPASDLSDQARLIHPDAWGTASGYCRCELKGVKVRCPHCGHKLIGQRPQHLDAQLGGLHAVVPDAASRLRSRARS
jgi:hypothetical protein